MGLYGILSGDKAWATFAYIKEEDTEGSYAVLMMSPTEAMYIKKEEIDDEFRHDNIEFIHRLPKNYYISCRAQFIYYAKKAGIYVGR